MKIYLIVLFLLSKPGVPHLGHGPDGLPRAFENKAQCEAFLKDGDVVADAKAAFGADFKSVSCKSIDTSKIVPGQPLDPLNLKD